MASRNFNGYKGLINSGFAHRSNRRKNQDEVKVKRSPKLRSFIFPQDRLDYYLIMTLLAVRIVKVLLFSLLLSSGSDVVVTANDFTAISGVDLSGVTSLIVDSGCQGKLKMIPKISLMAPLGPHVVSKMTSTCPK